VFERSLDVPAGPLGRMRFSQFIYFPFAKFNN